MRVEIIGAAACLAVAAVGACGGHRAASAPPREAAPAGPVLAAAAARREAEAARAPARSRPIATLERRALGPFVTRSGDAGLVAWIAASARGGTQDVVIVPLAVDGAPLAPPRTVATIPQEPTSLVVRPAGGGQGGWLLVWSTLLDRGEALMVLGLGPDGTPRAPAADLQRTTDHIQWSDVVPTAGGAVCVWAEESGSGDADILTAPVNSDGKPSGMPVRVVRGVDRWQALGAGDGVALALVAAGHQADGSRKDRTTPETLTWLRLDAMGRPRGDAVTVASGPTVGSDVDVVPTASGWLLAWTDRTGQDAQVAVAAVDLAGRVQGPKRAMNAVGGSTLVGLAGDAHGVALAWEEPHARARALRALHLATLPGTGELDARPASSIEVTSRGATELAVVEHGFALLAEAPTCDPGSAGACAGPVVPTVVRFDDHLAPTQAEPFFVGDSRAAAALAWGLSCSGDRCFALAATAESPTPVFTVDLPPRASPFGAPVTPPPPPGAPRVTGIATIASGQQYADIAAARLGDTTLVATLTSAVDAPADRARHGRAGATIALRPVGGDGQALGESRALTSRALTVGGVAMASAAQPGDEVAIAWVARDGGEPHVYVARVDARGKRTADVQLTRTGGEASSVAIAPVEGGWLVAWVDGRDGNGEVYAARLDRALRRVGPDERITTAPGDAADVSLDVRGDVAWLAWSDARESASEGRGDVYAATLRTRDARRSGDEVRVLATASHSRSPQIVATADGGALVGWIEDAPSGLDAPGAVMVAGLDPGCHVVGTPARLPLSGGAGEGAGAPRPTSLVLAVAGASVRAIVARSAGGVVALDAMVLGPGGAPRERPWPLLDLDAPSSFDVALAFAGDALLFDDVGAAPGDRRIRRVMIRWP